MSAPASPRTHRITIDTVIGSDGRTYQCDTVAAIDTHIAHVHARLKAVSPDLAVRYRDDIDKLLDRRAYLSLCQEKRS